MEYEEFEKKMKSARNAYIKAENKTRELLLAIENEFPNIELGEMETTNAENSNTVEEAVCCYLQHGEYSPKEIWDDILLGQINN